MKNIENINQINTDISNIDINIEYKKLHPVIDKLIESHIERIDTGVEKDNIPKLSKKDTLGILKITKKIFNTEEDNSEYAEILDKITKTEIDLNELNDLKSKYTRCVDLRQKKQSLSNSLSDDIKEISVKLERVLTEIDTMKFHMNEIEKATEGKEQKIDEQLAIISIVSSELHELRDKLEIIENTCIEGYTDDDILKLRELLDKINKEIESLKNNQRRQDEYWAIRKNELLERERYIIELKSKLIELGATEEELARPIIRKEDNKDELDKMVMEWIREFRCKVPIKRLGDGYYLFGTRKIFAKILNSQAAIRVGGGYIGLIEFLEQYSDTEFSKIERLKEKERVTTYEQISIIKSHFQSTEENNKVIIKRKEKSQAE